MKFRVSGIFEIETEARTSREAETKALKILREAGIHGIPVEVKEDKNVTTYRV